MWLNLIADFFHFPVFATGELRLVCPSTGTNASHILYLYLYLYLYLSSLTSYLFFFCSLPGGRQGVAPALTQEGAEFGNDDILGAMQKHMEQVRRATVSLSCVSSKHIFRSHGCRTCSSTPCSNGFVASLGHSRQPLLLAAAIRLSVIRTLILLQNGGTPRPSVESFMFHLKGGGLVTRIRTRGKHQVCAPRPTPPPGQSISLRRASSRSTLRHIAADSPCVLGNSVEINRARCVCLVPRLVSDFNDAFFPGSRDWTGVKGAPGDQADRVFQQPQKDWAEISARQTGD